MIIIVKEKKKNKQRHHFYKKRLYDALKRSFTAAKEEKFAFLGNHRIAPSQTAEQPLSPTPPFDFERQRGINMVYFRPIPIYHHLTEKNGHVWSRGKQLFVHATTQQSVVVYTLTGAIKKRLDLVAGETRSLLLPAGAYLVRLNETGEVYKVLVKEKYSLIKPIRGLSSTTTLRLWHRCTTDTLK